MAGAQIPDDLSPLGGGSSGRQSAADPALAAEGRATPVDALAPYGGDTKGTYDNTLNYGHGEREPVPGSHDRQTASGGASRVTASRNRGKSSPPSRDGVDGTVNTPRLPTNHDTY
jgi:hypothetical protein